MKRYVFIAIRLAVVALAITFVFSPQAFGFPEEVFSGVTPTSIIDHVKGLDAGHVAFWLTFAAVVKTLGIFAGVLRWDLLLRGQGIKLPFWYLTRCWFMGRMVGLFLPGTVGLDGYRLVESATYTGEAIKCTTVIAVEKLIGVLALLILVFLTLPLALNLFDFNLILLGILLTIILSVIAVSFLLLMNPRIVQVIAASVPTPHFIRSKVNKLGVAITAYSGHRGRLLLAVFFGLCVHLGICLMYFGNAMAMSGGETELQDVLFASPLVIVASVITPTVSGAGVREVGFGMLLGDKYGEAQSVLFGHLGLWVGEMVPFILSVPLLIFAGRPDRKKFLGELANIRAATDDDDDDLHISPEAVADYRGKLTKCVLAGLFAGVIGGAVYGLGEAVWHMRIVSDVAEVSAYLWAPIVYGITLAPMGLGAAAILVFLYLLFDRFAPGSITFGLCFGGTMALLTMTLGLFKYRRDVLGEMPIESSDLMLLGVVAAGLAVGGLVLGGLVVHFLRGGWGRAVAGGIAGFLLVVATGYGMSVINKPTILPVTFNPEVQADGPNIILIAVDTLRADYLRVYNPDATPETPNVTKFAEDAIRFQNNFAQSSWTKASFGTIFSGMYPEAHTATGKASALPDELRTFPEVLHDGGYFTKGYSNNPNITAVWNYGQGFVDYVDLKPDLYFGAQPSSEKLVLYDILRKVVNVVYGKLGNRISITDFYQPADVVTDTGLGWIDSDERPADAPFFLFLHYMDPHDPFRDPDKPGRGYGRAQMSNPDPDKYLEAFKRSYAYEIEYMDQHLGRLLDGLRERGLYDDTLIVFTADHGEEFYEHGGFWHGLSLYDEQIHVPLIIKLPGNTVAGKTNPFMARHVDLAPTIAQFAGLKPYEKWQGHGLFTDELDPANTDSQLTYAHLNFEGIILRAVRSMENKLIQANEGNKRDYAPVEFYDLIQDPGEQNNLAGDIDAIDPIQEFNNTITQMKDFILENKAEPMTSEAGMKQSKDDLEALGYLE